jgi:hypothetical protein
MGQPFEKTGFGYSIGTFHKQLVRGSGTTDLQGGALITCPMPQTEDVLILTIDIRARRLSGNYCMLIPAIGSAPQVTFYPEGGNLVRGLPCTIAFKTSLQNGLPVSVMGKIVDSKGNVLQNVYTQSSGLGKFRLIPQGDSCYLQLDAPKGKKISYPLPNAKENGLSIHYTKQTTDSIWFSIAYSDKLASNLATYWVVTGGHKILWSEKVQSPTAMVGIPKDRLPSRLVQVSVFDTSGYPFAERLIMVENTAHTLAVKMDHKTYHPRQRVNVAIEYSGKNDQLDLAMSVSLKYLTFNPLMYTMQDAACYVPCDSNISGYQTLFSDLELMSTSFRDVLWSEVISGTSLKVPYTRYDGITGTVYDKRNDPVQQAKVRITHIPNFRFYETQTNEKGQFNILFGNDIIDFKYLSINAYDALGKINLDTRVDQEYAAGIRKLLILDDTHDTRQKIFDVKAYGESDLMYALRYKPGKFRKSVSDVPRKYDPFKYAGYSSILEIIQEIRPYRVTDNTIVFAQDARQDFEPKGPDCALLVINGVPKGTQVNILEHIQPSDITNINVSSTLVEISKYTPLAYPAVVEITTIQGMPRYRHSTAQFGIASLNSNRSFFSPDYTAEGTVAIDNRRTLFWSPQVRCRNNQPNLVTFFTSDIKGVYYGIIEGIDEFGVPLSAEFSFVVE